MIWVWRTLGAVGVLIIVLGLFWLAQGIGLITVDPILCAASCEPVQAPSPPWQIAGALTALIGPRSEHLLYDARVTRAAVIALR